MTSTAEILEAYRRALGRDAHLLTRTPEATFQQLHNRLQWEGDAVERLLGPQRTRRSVRDARPWFRLHTRLPESRALVRTINGVGALAFARDSGALLTVGSGGVVTSWDVTTGAEIRTLQLSRPTGGNTVHRCDVSPDGSFLVASGSAGTIRSWDLRSGAERLVLRSPHSAATERGPSGPIHLPTTGMPVAVSPDGTRIVGGGEAGSVTIWDSSSGSVLRTDLAHEGQVTACAFSPDGSFVVSGGADGAVRVWDLVTETTTVLEALSGAARGHSDVADDHDGTAASFAAAQAAVELEDARLVRDLAVGPDALAVVAVTGERIRVWDVPGGRLRWDRQYFQPTDISALQGRGCAISPDGSIIAIFGEGRLVRLRDAGSGEIVSTLMGHADPVRACAISPDGALIATAADDGIRFWDSRVRGEWESLEGHDGHTAPVWGCAVSPDARHVLSASWDRTVRCWNAASGLEEARLDLPAKAHGAAFHPAGLRAVCGDTTGWVHVVELMGVELGPIVVTARDDDGEVSFRCPACQRDTPVDRRGLGSGLHCPGCRADLQLNATPIHVADGSPPTPSRPAGTASAHVGAAEDEGLKRLTKTCADCGNEFELLRHACPRCGSAIATPPSAEAFEFIQMRQQSATRRLDRGGQLFQQGRHDEAEAEFRRAIEANPWNATAHGNLGVVMLRRGRLEEAVHCFERALEIDPRVAGGREMLARARAELARR